MPLDFGIQDTHFVQSSELSLWLKRTLLKEDNRDRQLDEAA